MEEDPPFKLSVAELAGRFRGQSIASPTSNEEISVSQLVQPEDPPSVLDMKSRPKFGLHRRKLPCSLKLSGPRDDQEGESKKPLILLPKPFRVNTKHNSIIEKLQANLALSPNSLSPSPSALTPEVKLHTVCCPSSSPPDPCTPQGSPPPTPPHARQSSQEEEEEGAAVCFETPPEGNPLPSFHKTRARLSVKRRPPTRRHRQSYGEEGVDGNSLSPWQPETAGAGAERNSGGEEEKEESELVSRDTDTPQGQSESREEADCPQTVGGKDLARTLDPSEGERPPVASAGVRAEEVTTQNAPQHVEQEMS